MGPEQLSSAITSLLRASIAAGDLNLAGVDIPDVEIERPRNPEHGTYATNLAMVLAKRVGTAPRVLAESLSSLIAGISDVAAVDVAGPGFLNITLTHEALGEIAHAVVMAAGAYGRNDVLTGQSINLEFISANPTGPLHLGHTRWAAVGDALGRVLSASGADVEREFYINDRGAQLDRFAASLESRARGQEPPPDGYPGEYVTDMARTILAEQPGILDEPDARIRFREAGYAGQLDEQRRELDDFGTHFDIWTSERAFHESGAVERGLDTLRAQGHVYEADGATWLRTSDFGDDKDRVLIRSDGSLTYFASDTAYYVDKRARGFDRCIYLLGADHHGYVNRLRAVAACAGDDPDEHVEVLIGQMVKMLKDGHEVKLGKRTGSLVTLAEIVADVGVDATRYSLIRSPGDSPMTLDLDLIVSRTNDNPVYYVQYAHARIASVLRGAADAGIDWRTTAVDLSLLAHARESALLGAIAELPGVVATATALRQPHRVARYLEELATAFHKFYDSCRVLPHGETPVDPVNIARLWLAAAALQTLANGLAMLGVSAPERM